jgi:hypothetical protein
MSIAQELTIRFCFLELDPGTSLGGATYCGEGAPRLQLRWRRQRCNSNRGGGRGRQAAERPAERPAAEADAAYTHAHHHHHHHHNLLLILLLILLLLHSPATSDQLYVAVTLPFPPNSFLQLVAL